MQRLQLGQGLPHHRHIPEALLVTVCRVFLRPVILQDDLYLIYYVYFYRNLFLTVRLGLVSLYQAPRQERPTKEKHKTVKRLN
jgi:hypothetical protein